MPSGGVAPEGWFCESNGGERLEELTLLFAPLTEHAVSRKNEHRVVARKLL